MAIIFILNVRETEWFHFVEEVNIWGVSLAQLETPQLNEGTAWTRLPVT